MSDSDSDSETEALRKSRHNRSVVMKLVIKDSTSCSSSEDSANSSENSPIRKHTNKRKKQKRLDTTSESDDDSGSGPLLPRSRSATNKASKPLVYQDDESEDSDSSWSPSTEPVASTSSGRFRVTDSPVPSTSKAATSSSQLAADDTAGFSSDTSNDTTEKCPICLHSFREQAIGTPNTCDHTYCSNCIEEWSRNVQTCPIDRHQFSSITVRDRFENGRYLRTIQVEASSTELKVDDEDLTQCEVCNHTDREDRMLLCDGCNRGFHMDCLNPPLTEIPESSWYCDYCFASDESSDDADDINQLITEMEVEVGVPETRLRVRRVSDTPRITRTRQSERIRATIMSRITPTRNRTTANTNTTSESQAGVPGPSTRISTYTRTTTRTTTSKTSRKRRVRKSKRSSRRTYVVEYDIEEGGKFPLTTTKKVIKRKRKIIKRKKKSRRSTNGRRCGTTRSSRSFATAAGGDAENAIQETRGNGGAYPTLHLFGNPNTFEYFSDDEAIDLSDENAGRGLGGHDGGALLSATLTRTRIGSSTLRRQKRIISALDTGAPSVDVLSNIMDTMDRWHEMTKPERMEKIKIGNDGRLIIEGKPKNVANGNKKNDDIDNAVQNAPMYPRGGGSGTGVGGYNNQNNSFPSSGGYRGNANGANDSGSATTSSGMSFSIFGPRNTGLSTPNVSGSGGNGPTNNNSFNEFPSPRFPPNNPNRRNQSQQQQQSNFRPRNATPFNHPQRFQNRNFVPYSNNDQPQQQNVGGGLYDDPQMPPPIANSGPILNSLQMQSPPPQITIANAALQQMHMNTPPPSFHSAMNLIPPMLGLPPPPFITTPQFASPPPGNMFTTDHSIAQFPLQITPTATTSSSEQYDPTVDSEEPDEDDNEDQSLDIPLPTLAPSSRSAGLSGLADYGSDDDDENDCPNFSVYSTESMNVARNLETENLMVYGPANKPASDNECMENDEDLVQLDDDDDEVDKRADALNTSKTNSDATEDEMEKDKALMAKKNVLDLHDDSDWEELNHEKADENIGDEYPTHFEESAASNGTPEVGRADEVGEMQPDSHDDRSYTPCLDEQVLAASDKSGELDPDATSDDNDKSDNEIDEDEEDEGNQAGIAGMETELISDDEVEDSPNGKSAKSNRDKSGRESKRTADKRKDTGDPKKRDEKDKGKPRKTEKDESFKKISRSNKDRNYRDKKYDKRRRRRSASRTRSRSRSNNKENRGRLYKQRDALRRRDIKRQDIERYDVRNVIADRQPRSYKDKYGRDTSRPRSRSATRRRRSKSVSVSPSKRRSHSRPPRRSPSPRPRRRSPINRASYSPIARKRSRSPLLRDRSPYQSRITANGKNSNHLGHQQSRSLSPRLRLSRSPSPRAKNRKKNVKRKIKKRKISPEQIEHHSKKHSVGHDNVSNRSQSWDNVEKVTAWASNEKLSPWSRSPSPDGTGMVQNSSWTPPQGSTGGQQFTVILKNKEGKRKKDKKQRKSEKRKEVGLREKRERRKRDKHNGGVSGQGGGAGGSKQPSAPSKEVFASGDNILVSVSFNKDAANKTQQTTIVTLPPSKDQIVSKKKSEVAPPTRRNKRTSAEAATRKHKKVNLKPVAIIDLDRSPFKEMTPSPKAVIILTDSEREDDVDSGRKANNNHPNIIDTHSDIIDNSDELHDVEQVSQPQSPNMEDFDLANSSGGPKTPPEPQVVKFSLPLKSKNKLRNVNNPLHDAIEEEQHLLLQQQQQQPSAHVIEPSNDPNCLEVGDISDAMSDILVQSSKVGPNTPPGPRSPDAYDPFEPTKSGSASPETNNDHQGHSSSGGGNDDDDDDRTDSHTPDLPPLTSNDIDKHQPLTVHNEKIVKPVDLALALINSKASLDAANSFLSSTLEGGVDACDNPSIQCIDDDDDYDDDVQIVSSTSGKEKPPIQVLSNVRLTNSSRVTSASQGVPYLTKAALKANTSSPLRPGGKPGGGNLITKLPLPKPIVKPVASTSRHNGGGGDCADGGADFGAGHESPYSPDSSDYDDLFEPPTASPTQNKGAGAAAKLKPSYDDMFGGAKSPMGGKFGRNKKLRPRKPAAQKAAKPSSTVPTQNILNRLTEDQMRLFDDVPNSAVDMLVKDKYLRKLNRQERVVEEVKLVLKPHYYKKRISKEDYKDILRRSVPKICHNRTGEINPKKIKNLVEAYVRKFRHRRKQTGGASVVDGTTANG